MHVNIGDVKGRLLTSSSFEATADVSIVSRDARNIVWRRGRLSVKGTSEEA